MTLKNREAMNRAIGIIEGASYGASEKVQNALCNALEILESVLEEEAEIE